MFKKTVSFLLAIIIVFVSVPFACTAEASSYKKGDIIQFGSYPQSRITDGTLLNRLNSLDLDWKSYNYYFPDDVTGETVQTDCMQYCDVVYGNEKYRAVITTQNRSYSQINGYKPDEVYWFVYEPINWRVLDPSTGLVFCTTIIDSQPYSNLIYGDNPYYQDTEKTIYADDYANSNIRNWTTNIFYNTAFTQAEKAKIITTNLTDVGVNDKVFSLSYAEATNSGYGFSSSASSWDSLRRALGSDYAKSQGLHVMPNTVVFVGYSHWWLRNEGTGNNCPYAIYDSGIIGALYAANINDQGVRPAMRLDLSSIEKKEYSINLYSAMPAMTLNTNMSADFIAELVADGQVVENYAEFAIASSNTDIAYISQIDNCSDGVRFKVNTGNKPGKAHITLTELNSGTVYSATVNVKDNVVTYNSTAMPVFYDFGTYNGYVDGMYISDYSYEDTADNKARLFNFSVFNATDTIGAVEIYNADGELINLYAVDRHNGTKFTSYKDTLINCISLLGDLLSAEALTFKQNSYATETKLENVYVPKGGYIKITNSLTQSPNVALLNTVAYIINTVCVSKEVVDTAANAEKIYKDVNRKLLKKILNGELIATANEMNKKFADLSAQKLTEGIINEVGTQIINDGNVLLSNSGIDIVDMMASSAIDLGISFAEDVASKIFGETGVVIEGLFALGAIADLVCWTIDLCFSNQNAFEIYVDTYDNKLCSNGVTVSKDEGMSDYSENNFVLKSIVVSENSFINGIAEKELDTIAEQYIVRDIYLEKDGKAAQPGETVTVSIPIPRGYNSKLCAVYRITDDGSLEKLDSTVSDGYIHFSTNHFSYYALVELHVHNYQLSETVSADCITDGYKEYTCSCNSSYTETVTANGHNFGGSICTDCGLDKAESCSCDCHKSGFMGFIWKILCLFYKLFGTNSVCKCGAEHY